MLTSDSKTQKIDKRYKDTTTNKHLIKDRAQTIQLKKQKEQIIHLAIMINIQIAMFVWNIQNRTIMELKIFIQHGILK